MPGFHQDLARILLDFIKSYYPDLRKCINELQKNSVDKKLSLISNNNSDVLNLIFQEVKNKNVIALRKALIENESKFNNDYVSLLRHLFNFIYNAELNDNIKRTYLLTLSEYIYRSSFVVDQEINCFSCLIALSNIS